MSLKELILGRPLRSEEQEAQRIGPMRGIPLLGLDALASASYGPEAALTVLIPLGLAATLYVQPITYAIIGILSLVYLSYRQTIAAYPNGGGSYTVCSQNLGPMAGLIAASALSVDYILNAAVAISSGVGAVVSAVPPLLPYTLWLCLGILLFLTIANLRGVREAGLVFMLPTYLFVLSLGGTIVFGVVKVWLAQGHPTAIVRNHATPHALAASASLWLLLRAFANGCTAMTGVEAVSNGVPLFREPTVRLAQRTLTYIIAILALLLAGVAYLSSAYHITATTPGQPGYESVLSQITSAVTGRGAVYYLTLSSVFAVLCLSANTSFSDFPRVCRVLAMDNYLPAEFAHPGRRLVFSYGIILLTICAGLLLIVFGGITDRLIPLFAVGAFLAFTMSQLGMVAHWRRKPGLHARRKLILNAAGALATGITLLVVVVSKFTEGAWMTVIVIPLLVLWYVRYRASEDKIEREIEASGPLVIKNPPKPLIVVPIKRLDRLARKALRLAITLSPDVQAVQIHADELDFEDLRRRWSDLVEKPCARAGFNPPRLVFVQSEYREFFGPLLDYVRQLARAHPHRYIGVVVPQLVQVKWYHFFLRHRASLLKGMLLLRGGPHIVVISTPWYIRGDDDDEGDEPLQVHDLVARRSTPASR